MRTKRYDLPPVEFSNAMNDINENFNWQNWRQSSEWKLFVTGYNTAVKSANNAVMSRYNMGENIERLFRP